MRCADCGEEVESRRDGWWSTTPNGGHSAVCRIIWGGSVAISTIDYHYVEGETQRHFQASSSQA